MGLCRRARWLRLRRGGCGRGRRCWRRCGPLRLGSACRAFILRQPRQCVKDVRAPSAANVTLRYPQIRCGDDESQGALWTDREHANTLTVIRSPLPAKANPTLALSERSYIKACVVSACHVDCLLLHEPGQDQVPAGADQT